MDELLESIVEPAEDDGEDGNILSTVAYRVAFATLSNKRCGPREKPIDRAQQRELWSSGYVAGTWSENGFKACVHVTKENS